LSESQINKSENPYDSCFAHDALEPRGESAENLKFMALIDAQFLKTPGYGSRQMARHMQSKTSA